ncbi:response regulator [Clostridium botulinum]|uniref:Stage 0 sporulation protein A homolog n=1 Tax=Clostridium botulinum (strain Eklund 17B / Type B) TaxID=935198 RepID=B2TLK9_CLOBB|nr:MULTISPECIES: response regulator [Clostridium]ACD22935.1 DNA-binding response regulator, AraC family [Clostridium botulinum B str. Eklund 17B (NRP)]KFX56008.1 chemotaxis protein CheY [Clostridium botulinum]MBN1045694.1 DNA-binding response regulator [Clostridium botulinum]MBN1055550.1 DNA-binding response regulator [Clostridium botulinum]MBN1068155.1 DNA-binding response regulator [Clostridium botulinum]
MLNIMIVDDEILERQALKMIINNSDSGRVIAEACNGREAIELDRKFNPDVIIIDVKMPGIDGIKASQIIKEQNKNKIIIMITAYDDFELVHKALLLGVNDYILKPIKPSELIDAINNIFVNLKINKDTYVEKSVNELKEVPIKAAIEYIHNNFDEKVSLEQMASICNLSPCYFSKVFKKAVGVNFVSYVNDTKINKAKELLENTDIPVLNVALDLGFDDCGYFIRVFKKSQGVTPKKYREVHKAQ